MAVLPGDLMQRTINQFLRQHRNRRSLLFICAVHFNWSYKISYRGLFDVGDDQGFQPALKFYSYLGSVFIMAPNW